MGMPFELRPYPRPTLPPEGRYLQTVWPQSVYPVAERFGIELRLPSVSPQPDTALAWQGYQYARARARAGGQRRAGLSHKKALGHRALASL